MLHTQVQDGLLLHHGSSRMRLRLHQHFHNFTVSFNSGNMKRVSPIAVACSTSLGVSR
ncbi:hypothetical protein HanRHA438_Chr12g0538891 [Helianthus annuus]|nr:hypothetical protein HanRHA438_Chr12g0538891 [Helianthus annuus]